jgi:hypothetical protein
VKHNLRRYYLLVGVSVFLSTAIFISGTADRSWGSIVFNIVIFSGIFGLIFLYMDYVFTVLNKHKYMKFFYVLFVIAAFYYYPFPAPEALQPIIAVAKIVAVVVLAITIVVSNIYYWIKVTHEAKEGDEIRETSHAIHIFSKAYQKQQASKDPLEVQLYDFFAEKIQGYNKKKNIGEPEKVSV